MTTHEQMIKALTSLSPNADWTLRGGDFDNIEWHCDCPKPTLDELVAESARLDEVHLKEKADQESAKQAILDRLGLTADEAKLLLS